MADAITGTFDPNSSTLPKEVLITVMRHHQKYFSVEMPDGNSRPQFVAVTNTDGDPDGLIRHGNERVLRARFNDARFFWDADQKRKLSERVQDLANVTFQAKLGSYLREDRAHGATGPHSARTHRPSRQDAHRSRHHAAKGRYAFGADDPDVHAVRAAASRRPI